MIERTHITIDYLDSLPWLPRLHSLVESIFDGAHNPDVVVDELGQQVEVVLGLLLVHLLHLLLHVGELLQRRRQLRVILSTSQQP